MRSGIARPLLIYPVHYLRGEPLAAFLDEVTALNSGRQHRIISHQKRLLCQVLLSCIDADIPLYRGLARFRQVLNPDDVLKVLEEAPLLTKDVLRDAVKSYGRSKNHRLDYRTTSGSTGLPFSFYKDRLATGYMDAVQYAAYGWHGIKVGEPQSRFWGMPLTPRGWLVAKVKDLLKNRIRFSAFDLSRGAMLDFYLRMQHFKPKYFYGYPSLIAEFCRFAEEEDLDLGSLGLKAVVGTGEFVYQKEREIIETVTRTRFVSEYGCTEVGVVGFECKEGNLHVMASNVHVEVIRDGRSVVDEEGDIYLTELHATHFPFVRYGVGDRGVLSSRVCACGRHLPILDIVSGRKDDYVITPEGAKVYDAVFAYVLKKGIEQFRAVQTDINRVEIFAKVNGEFSTALQQEYADTLKKNLSPSIDIIFIVVDSIERQKSGKLRYFERKC